MQLFGAGKTCIWEVVNNIFEIGFGQMQET